MTVTRTKQIQNDLKLVGEGPKLRSGLKCSKILKIKNGPKMSKFCYFNK